MSFQHYFLKCLSRHSFLRNNKSILTSHFVNQRRPCSSSSDSSDEENGTPKSKNEIKKEKARSRMKGLLTSFTEAKTDKEFRSPSTSKSFGKDVDENKKEIKSTAKSDEEILLKAETKNKMMNLLSTLQKKTYSRDEAIKITQAQPRKEPEKTESEVEFVDFSVQKAVKDVADLLGGDKDKNAETVSELLQSLRSVTSAKQDLSAIVSEMKVSDSKDFEMKRTLDRKFPASNLYEFRKMTLPQNRMGLKIQKINLLGAKPLNMFPKDFKPEGKESVLSLWDSLNEREIKFSISHPPRNYFEEMINWTEDGKVWTFPIDNEIGLEEEKSYSFADHIFLEDHLSEWCPKKGPIRHFMELVCVGLSKNPYLTVNRKKAHIEWYKDYFVSKKNLLQDIGAM